MCGLVGIAGDLAHGDESTIKRLLVYDYFRGVDSTGIAAFRKNGDFKLAKMASHPLDLFDTKRFVDACSGYNSFGFIGHNRAATKGKVNGANAHPYEYGNIVGAHNGTLDQASWTRLNQALGYETDVDSQAVIACIDKIGIDETIALMTEGRQSNEGAWALTWFDKTDGTLNFIRNKWRPLWYAYTEDFKKIIWASEWPMIEAATKLSTIGYKLYHNEEHYRFWEVAENMHYKFDLKELAAGSHSRPTPVVGEIKGREPAPVYTPAGTAPFHPIGGQNGRGGTTMGRPPQSGNSTNTGTSSTTTYPGTTTSNGQGYTTPEILQIPTAESDPLGLAMSRGRFQEIAAHGCSWCGCEVKYGDAGITIYDSTDHILCAEHSDNRGNTRIYTKPSEIRAVKEQLEEIAGNLIAQVA